MRVRRTRWGTLANSANKACAICCDVVVQGDVVRCNFPHVCSISGLLEGPVWTCTFVVNARSSIDLDLFLSKIVLHRPSGQHFTLQLTMLFVKTTTVTCSCWDHHKAVRTGWPCKSYDVQSCTCTHTSRLCGCHVMLAFCFVTVGECISSLFRSYESDNDILNCILVCLSEPIRLAHSSYFHI